MSVYSVAPPDMILRRGDGLCCRGEITCRADGAVFLALIARGWRLVALADGWARLEPKSAHTGGTP